MPDPPPNGDGPQCNDVTYCDNIESHECYYTTVQNDCCLACKDNEVNISNCRYGDRIINCDNYHASNCYDTQFRDNCCGLCFQVELNITGCEYGDLVPGCKYNECVGYSTERKNNCCHTCLAFLPPPPTPGPTNYSTSTTTPQNNTTHYVPAPPKTQAPTKNHYTPNPNTPKPATSSTSSTTPFVTTNYQSTDSTVTALASSKDLPTWVVPVAASAGGILFLVFLLILYICIRRRSGSGEHLSPIDEKMYNQYKLSKRPPVAVPRPSLDNRPPLIRQDSAGTYAYIDPRHLDSNPSTKKFSLNGRRIGSDPLPPIPDENDSPASPDTDKYGYFQPIADDEATVYTVSENDTVATNNPGGQQLESSPKRQNTYQKYPPEHGGGLKYANVNNNV